MKWLLLKTPTSTPAPASEADRLQVIAAMQALGRHILATKDHSFFSNTVVIGSLKVSVAAKVEHQLWNVLVIHGPDVLCHFREDSEDDATDGITTHEEAQAVIAALTEAATKI